MSFASAGSWPFMMSVTPSKNSLNSSVPLWSASIASKRSFSSSRPSEIIAPMTSWLLATAFANSSRVMSPVPSVSMRSNARRSSMSCCRRSSSWLLMMSLSVSKAIFIIFSQKMPMMRLRIPKVVTSTKTSQKRLRKGMRRTVGWITSTPQPSDRQTKSVSIVSCMLPKSSSWSPISSLKKNMKLGSPPPAEAGHMSPSTTSVSSSPHTYLAPICSRAKIAKM
mmetsp:Transcript_94905/g.306361  ORF Transcript_94905/g.306361 Transcript_94905/m.306361 type:complete len:223 (+) Transcript_94905:285-953(+)